MNKLLLMILTPASPSFVQLGLAFLRISLGIIMISHGFPKIIGGFEKWHQLGLAMKTLGIYFLPTFWGLCAALTETLGGTALIFGFGTRIAAALLTFMMLVALLFHVKKGDPFMVYSHALSLLIVFAMFTIIGGGTFSVDYCLSQKK